MWFEAPYILLIFKSNCFEIKETHDFDQFYFCENVGEKHLIPFVFKSLRVLVKREVFERNKKKIFPKVFTFILIFFKPLKETLVCVEKIYFMEWKNTILLRLFLWFFWFLFYNAFGSLPLPFPLLFTQKMFNNLDEKKVLLRISFVMKSKPDIGIRSHVISW